jgi:AsmA protein
MEGTAQIDAFLTTRGDDIDFILKGLNGNGAILVEDGAVKGINVEEMVQHIKAAYLKFKGSEPSQKQDFSGRTDFSRLHAPFEIKNGLAATDNTSLTAPGLRLTATGNADLVNQTLNFKLSPKFVATIQGQGDKDKRSGITVPILVQGSFSSPVFRPDMKSMIEEGINLLPEIQKRFLKEKETKSTDDSEADKTDEKPLDQIKNLLRSLPK